MIWLIGILGLILLIFAIVVIRALLLKPTMAATVTLPPTSEVREKKYAEKLSKMIQCETVSYRGQTDITQFEAYQMLLKKLFPLVFQACDFHSLDGSLLLKWKGKCSRSILLLSHQDVVAAEGTWKYGAFSGTIENGIVWGRGTVDTKGSAFCFFQAVEELIEEGFVPDIDVYLAGSCTEEWSGPGAKKTMQWLKEHNVFPEMILDEGGMILENPIAGVRGTYAMIGVVEKGYGDLRFVAKGHGGHASAPDKGTPWARLAGMIQQIEKHDPFRAELSPTVKELFRRFAPNMKFGMRLIFANLWIFSPLVKKLLPRISPAGGAMLKTTIAFTMGKGSEGYNVLPQHAYVTGNMRFIPHQPTDESIEIVTKIAKKYDVETEVIEKGYPCPPVSFDGEAFQRVENVLHKIYPGVDAIPYVMTAGTDCKDYVDICTEAIRFAPIFINEQQYESIHAADENVNASSLVLAVDFYRCFLKEYH